MIATDQMTKTVPVDSKTSDLAITTRDIVFACPSCGKNLVVDEAAEGLIVDCPQCHTSVIVPPKAGITPVLPTAKPALAPKNQVPEQRPVHADGDDLRGRLATINGKLKELQTQRTEINNRLASRANDINRDLVMMARLETAQQQVIGELTQLINQIGALAAGSSANSARTRVNLRS
jgi:predicted RNA-binding Zn-ribbon protein involved in translation (DUF1610 family)